MGSMERSMGGFLLLLLVTLITPLVAQEYQCDPTPNGLSDNCIGCICEASTRCNATTKCISGGSFCGPFLLKAVLGGRGLLRPRRRLTGRPRSVETLCVGHHSLCKHNPLLHQQIWKGL